MNREEDLNSIRRLESFGWRIFNPSVIERWHRREITIEKYGGRK